MAEYEARVLNMVRESLDKQPPCPVCGDEGDWKFGGLYRECYVAKWAGDPEPAQGQDGTPGATG